MAAAYPAVAPAAAGWRIAAQLLSGELLAEQWMQPSSTVGRLREAIAEAAGTQGCLHLVHGGATLAEHLTIAEAGLCDGACVVVVRTAGLRVATTSAFGSGGVHVWSVDSAHGTKRLLATLTWAESALQSLAISPDGALVALGFVEPYPGDHEAAVGLWHSETGRRRHLWKVQDTSHVQCVAFSPDGRTLAAGVGSVESGSVVLFDLETCQQRAKFEAHSGTVYAAAFSPSEGLLITGSADLTAKVWRSETCERLGTFARHRHAVLSACVSPGGALVATTSEDGVAMLWSPDTCELAVTLLGHDDQICSAGFSPDGALLATASSDGSVKVWEVGGGRCMRTFQYLQEDVRFAAFSPDGCMIIAGSDVAVRLWNVETATSVVSVEGEVPMAISKEM